MISSLSNKNLMDDLKNGSSQRAYKLLYNRLWKNHFTQSYAILGDKDLAKDVVQNVWISLWERREEIEVENIEAYLYRAVKFGSYKEIRNTAYREKLVQDFSESTQLELTESSIENQYHLEDLNKAVLETVNTLPNRCKEVFEMSRNQGLPNTEIAEKLQISKRTVETHISNALKVLRNKVALSITVLSSLIIPFF